MSEEKTDLYVPPAKFCLHSSFGHTLLKSWNTPRTVTAGNILYPIFVTAGTDVKTEISSLPGQYRWSVDRLPELLDPLVELGLKSVLIFGVVSDESLKDERGSYATIPDSPVIRSLKFLSERYPSLLLVTDVCLCAYTSHGHCGILKEDRSIDNQPSINRIAEIAVAYAKAGSRCVAPSDMMDGRIGAIKAALRKEGLDSTTAVMAYSAKFASCMYGPFRDAAGSGAKFGSRANYQLPPGSHGLAVRAIERDIAEGADFVMVKPGGPYLDVVAECAKIADKAGIPVAIYQVSGEYAMLYHAAKAGAFGLEEAVMESLNGMRRAGCTILITYFAELALKAIKNQ